MYPHGGPQLFHKKTYFPQQPPVYMSVTSHKPSPTSILEPYNPSTFMPSHFPQTYSSMSLSDPPEEMW
ncbi:hypothetical protein AtEden1_Chr5g0133601 [Arabidopsis thaliana]